MQSLPSISAILASSVWCAIDQNSDFLNVVLWVTIGCAIGSPNPRYIIGKTGAYWVSGMIWECCHVIGKKLV